MSLFFGLLSESPEEIVRGVAQITAGALIAGLWQSLLLVAGVWLTLKVVPHTTAAVRFAVWTAVFCVSAALPVVGDLFGARAGGVVAPEAPGHLQVDLRWSYLLAGIWLLTAVIRLGQLAVQGFRLRALWKNAIPMPAEAIAGSGCGELLAERAVQLCVSDDVDRPSVIGFFSPKILVPAWLLEQMSAVELQHIVLHETEHLRRHDDWINLIQKIALVVFPLNPALFWVDRKLATERELACDDGVLRKTHMPRTYATCLASIAERRLERRMYRRVVALALGVFGAAGLVRGRSEFGRRIESILNRRAALNPSIASGLAAALVFAILGAGAGMTRAPQLVSFVPAANVRDLAALPMHDRAASASRTAAHNETVSGARLQSVGFHEPGTKAISIPLAKVVRTTKPVTSVKTQAAPETETARPSRAGDLPGEQWMVLTSFDEDAPARVVVRLADGRFYVAPYAAVPVRDGWLIVQL